MRKTILLGLIILTFISLGCGKDSSEEKTEKAVETKTKTAEIKISVLDTKEAMMVKLAEYKITVPGDMVFRSVDKQVYLTKDFEEKDTYLVYFDIKYKDRTKKMSC